MDDIGLSSFLPEIPGDKLFTPEEENARMIQGDIVEPSMNEDQVYHIKVHTPLLYDATLPPEVMKQIKEHIQKTIEAVKTKITFQLATGQQNQGVPNGEAPVNRPAGVVQPAGMAMG
jgi:hypothetical protein